MKKTVFHRVVAAFLVLVLSVSAICVPVSAVGFDLPPDSASVNLWSSSLQSPANTVLNALAEAVGASPVVNTVFWSYMDRAVGSTGPHTLDYMNDLVGRYHQAFNSEPGESFLLSALKGSQALGRQTFASCFFAQGLLDFELAKAPSGLYRIREKNSGRWVVNSAGEYPYCEGGNQAPTCGGNQWVGERSCSTAKTNMKNLDTLNLLCNKIKESGTPAQIKPLGTNYKAIWYNRQYYCDPEGRPFVCYANEGQAAINQPRPDTSVKDEDGKPATDENGTVINNPNNSTNIDLSGMTITLPDGTVQVADGVIYDESTKTYNIDSHDTTNYMKQSRVITWAQKHPGKFSAWLLASKFFKRCTPVYSNVPITGAFQLEPQADIGKYMITDGKVIIDEAGIEYNNRNFKSFPKEAIYWYKYHRHYECSVDVFSQSYEDMDITLKRLAQNYFVVKKSLLPFFIVCKSIKRKIGIDDTTHQIIDKYYFGLPVIGTKWVFSPVLWKLFNSYSRKELPEKAWAKW